MGGGPLSIVPHKIPSTNMRQLVILEILVVSHVFIALCVGSLVGRCTYVQNGVLNVHICETRTGDAWALLCNLALFGESFGVPAESACAFPADLTAGMA